MVLVSYKVEWMDGENKKTLGGMEIFPRPDVGFPYGRPAKKNRENSRGGPWSK